jgi:hypothetical protein
MLAVVHRCGAVAHIVRECPCRAVVDEEESKWDCDACQAYDRMSSNDSSAKSSNGEVEEDNGENTGTKEACGKDQKEGVQGSVSPAEADVASA